MRRKPMFVAAATALCLVVSGAPAASAASTPSAKSVNRKVNTVNTRVTRVNSHVNKAAKAIKALEALGRTLTGKTTDQGASLAAALAGVPAIVDGLTQLKDGLTTLASVVSTQIGPGLTKLGDAYQAVEYGRSKVVSTDSLSPVQNTAVTSSDIPDDGNPAVANGTALFATNTATPVASTLDVLVDVRSNESDNNAVAGQTGPVGQAGGSMYIKDVTPGASGFVGCGAPYNTGGNPGVAGTPAGDSIVTPSGTVTNLTLVNIVNGKLRTDTTDPSPTAVSRSIFPVPCTFTPAVSHLYEVSTQVNFVDIPTTTTPGPKE